MRKSMEDRDGVIWVDGDFVPWREARIHMLSYTFQHGAGVFEGVRAYAGALGTAIFRLRDHTIRLFNSAKILQMQIPFTLEQVEAAQVETVRRSGLPQCYIRPVCYYDGTAVGVSASGNGVHVAIAAWEWNDYLGGSAQREGISVKTSSFNRHHVNSTLGKAKATGNYINSMLANAEARQQGFDDALMLDTNGCVAECSTSNIFVVQGRCISTPDRTAILQGITRDTAIELARERNYKVEERRITRDEIYCADEVFITGTAAELTPVVALDNRVIGTGKPGPVTLEIQTAFKAAVEGRDPNRHHWLTPIS